MRVYIATTLDGLRALQGNGFQPPVAAHAVTGALREWYLEGDAEELEYAASSQAAQAALRLLAGADGPVRRVVVAADVPDDAVRPGEGARSAVVVDAVVGLAEVVSLHVDDADAAADLERAVALLADADAGGEDAQLAVEDAADHDLLWYDVSELDDVLALP